MAHHVALELAGRVAPVRARGEIVMHTCDVPACVNPDHLRVGTHTENMVDMVAKGRQSRVGRGHGRGDAHPSTRLSDATIAAIRTEYAAGGVLQTSLAKKYGCSREYMNTIISGKARRLS
jgi:hypothetical protein